MASTLSQATFGAPRSTIDALASHMSAGGGAGRRLDEQAALQSWIDAQMVRWDAVQWRERMVRGGAVR